MNGIATVARLWNDVPLNGVARKTTPLVALHSDSYSLFFLAARTRAWASMIPPKHEAINKMGRSRSSERLAWMLKSNTLASSWTVLSIVSWGINRLDGQSQVKIRADPTRAGSILGSFSQLTSDASDRPGGCGFQIQVSGDFVSRPGIAIISTSAPSSFSGGLTRSSEAW